MILKTVWRSTQVFVQMDFSENYKCSDEVQPAYWNFTLVTIYPSAIYFKQNNFVVQKAADFVVCSCVADKKNILANFRKLIMMVKKC